MPSASAAVGYGKRQNTLKWLSLCFLLLCTFKLIANVKVRNYSEEKLQCFLSLVSKGLETNKFQSLITIGNEEITKDSENYENISLAAYETSTNRKISDEWSKIDPDWNMAACGKGQATSQRRLQNELSSYLSKNEGKDDLDGGKTLKTNHSAYLCHGRDARGSARRVFDPGGHDNALQISCELPTTETDDGSKATTWSAWQTTWWATFGVGSPNFARVTTPENLHSADCIFWQYPKCSCRVTVSRCNDTKKVNFQRFF